VFLSLIDKDDIMSKERKAFEKMMKDLLRDYFSRNMGCLIRGNIRIEDDMESRILRIYRKCSEDNVVKYDIGIVY